MKDIILKPGTFYKTIKNSTSDRIPGESLESYVVELLKSPTCCAKYVTLTKSTVTQGTSITTGVTINSPSGVITTVALTTAANAAEAPFTVSNTYVKSDSIVLANIVDYDPTTSTNDLPLVYIDDIANGSFKVIVGNGGSGVLDAAVKIAFVVL
jgi:hypothetical protein